MRRNDILVGLSSKPVVQHDDHGVFWLNIYEGHSMSVQQVEVRAELVNGQLNYYLIHPVYKHHVVCNRYLDRLKAVARLNGTVSA